MEELLRVQEIKPQWEYQIQESDSNITGPNGYGNHLCKYPNQENRVYVSDTGSCLDYRGLGFGFCSYVDLPWPGRRNLEFVSSAKQRLLNPNRVQIREDLESGHGGERDGRSKAPPCPQMYCHGNGDASGKFIHNIHVLLNSAISVPSFLAMAASANMQRTKSRSVSDQIIHTLVSQLADSKEKINSLAIFVFPKSKLSVKICSRIKAHDIVHRILLLELHALNSEFISLAPVFSDMVVLKQKFVEDGLRIFDILCRARDLTFEGSLHRSESRVLKIACIGGMAAAEAVAAKLFMVKTLPEIEVQVDVINLKENWHRLIDGLALKGIFAVEEDFSSMIQGSTATAWKEYSMLICLAGFRGSKNSKEWDEFWQIMYQRTNSCVMLLVENWEQVKPKKNSPWWSSPVPGESNMNIVRKRY